MHKVTFDFTPYDIYSDLIKKDVQINLSIEEYKEIVDRLKEQTKDNMDLRYIVNTKYDDTVNDFPLCEEWQYLTIKAVFYNRNFKRQYPEEYDEYESQEIEENMKYVISEEEEARILKDFEGDE